MIAKLLSLPIRFYRRYISPNKPPCCIFTPTCSQYALEALAEWGAVCGTALAVWRILRCHPFSRGGYDPVPINRRRRARQQKKSEQQQNQTQNRV